MSFESGNRVSSSLDFVDLRCVSAPVRRCDWVLAALLL